MSSRVDSPKNNEIKELSEADEETLVSTPRRSQLLSSSITLKKSSTVIKSSVADKKVREEISSITAESLNANMKFEDTECDPASLSCLRGLAASYKIDKSLSKDQFEKVTFLINDVSDKSQEIFKKFELYGLPEEMGETFFKHFRYFCKALKKYYATLEGGFKKGAEKGLETQRESIIRAFKSLKFVYDEYIVQYGIVNGLLSRRGKMDEEVPKRGIIKEIARRFWSLTKWLWKYKYVLYISGMLLYNVYNYVYLPWSSGINLLIQLCGSICYTFAADRVSLSKLLEFIGNSVYLILYGLFRTIIPGFGLTDYIPGFIKKTFHVGRAIVFYLFLHFSLDWIAYIIRLTCQGIVIFGFAFEQGTKTMNDIWGIFAESAEQIRGSVSNALKFISDFLVNSGVTISNMITKIFVDTIYNDILQPSYNYVAGLPSRILQKIKNSWSWWGNSKGDEFEEVRKGLSEGIRGSGDIVTKENDEFVMVEFLEKFATSDSKEIQSVLESQQEKFVSLVQEETEVIFGEIKSVSLETISKVKEKVESSFEKTIREQGTEKLWNDLQGLKFSGGELAKYISIILFVFALLSIYGIEF